MTRKLLASLLASVAVLAPMSAYGQTISYSPNTLPLSGSCGTVAASTPCLNLTQNWAGVGTFTGLKFNVPTDSGPSAAGSLLLDLQVGGVSQFSVRKDGSAVTNTLYDTLGVYKLGWSAGVGQPVVAVGGLTVTQGGLNATSTAYYHNIGNISINQSAIGSNGTVPIDIIQGNAGQPFRFSSQDYATASNNVNAIQFNRTLTGVSPSIQAVGSDANINLNLTPKGTGTVVVSNGVNPQKFRVYETFTDASNGAWLDLYSTGSQFVIQPGANGGGAARKLTIGTVGPVNLEFTSNSSTRWVVDSTGNYVAGTDNAYDIGASGANRPRNLYVAGTASVGSLLSAASLTAGAASGIGFNGLGYIAAPSDGVFRLHNNADTQTATITVGASNLLTFQGGGTFGGNVYASTAGTSAVPSLQVGQATNGLFKDANNWVGIAQNGVYNAAFTGTNLFFRNDGVVAFVSGTNIAGTAQDTGISRASANTIAFGNGTQGDVTGTLFANAYRAGGSGQIYWNGRATLASPADGVLQLQNAANTLNSTITLGASNLLTFQGEVSANGYGKAGGVAAAQGLQFSGSTTRLNAAGSGNLLSFGDATGANYLLMNSTGATFNGPGTFGGDITTTGNISVGNAQQLKFTNGPTLYNSGTTAIVLRDNTATNSATITVGASNLLTFQGGITSGGNVIAANTSYVKSGATVVSNLPSASSAGAGARLFVTDATATTFLSTVVGGGANKVPVVSDGTNWLIG